MLNNANIAYLEENNYKYILAAKTRSIINDLKEKITNLTFIDDGTIHTLKFNKDISYKEKIDEDTSFKINKCKSKISAFIFIQKGKKDKYNRDKTLQRLEENKDYKNITKKKDLKLSYYVKYLNIDDQNVISLLISIIKNN